MRCLLLVALVVMVALLIINSMQNDQVKIGSGEATQKNTETKEETPKNASFVDTYYQNDTEADTDELNLEEHNHLDITKEQVQFFNSSISKAEMELAHYHERLVSFQDMMTELQSKIMTLSTQMQDFKRMVENNEEQISEYYSYVGIHFSNGSKQLQDAVTNLETKFEEGYGRNHTSLSALSEQFQDLSLTIAHNRELIAGNQNISALLKKRIISLEEEAEERKKEAVLNMRCKIIFKKISLLNKKSFSL